MKIEFTIHGPPVPKERARVFQEEDDTGKMKSRGRTPQRTSKYEGHVKRIAWLQRRTQCPAWPMSNEIRYGLRIDVYYSGNGGDLDNYMKAIVDGCEGVLWPNDRQIFESSQKKEPVKPGSERVRVEAWRIE